LALPALDEVGPNVPWTLGGGTALALEIQHRISYDIDVFVKDGDLLRALSPNRNKAARRITDHWQEPGNYIKLEREEGAIDFILASDVTDVAPWPYRFRNREIRIDDPVEILAKKLKYRGSQMVPRDIFDILAIDRFDPEIARKAAASTPEGARRAADRIRRMLDRYRQTIADEVNPTTGGAEILDIDPLRAIEILSG